VKLSLLMADKRVEVNRPNWNGDTPLHLACEGGNSRVVELLLAANSRVDPNTRNVSDLTPLTSIYQKKDHELNALISEFKNDPKEVMGRLRNRPSNRKYFAGYLFAAAVLFADGYVKMKDEEGITEATRFFGITSALPLRSRWSFATACMDLGMT